MHQQKTFNNKKEIWNTQKSIKNDLQNYQKPTFTSNVNKNELYLKQLNQNNSPIQSFRALSPLSVIDSISNNELQSLPSLPTPPPTEKTKFSQLSSPTRRLEINSEIHRQPKISKQEDKSDRLTLLYSDSLRKTYEQSNNKKINDLNYEINKKKDNLDNKSSIIVNELNRKTSGEASSNHSSKSSKKTSKSILSLSSFSSLSSSKSSSSSTTSTSSSSSASSSISNRENKNNSLNEEITSKSMENKSG